MTFSRFVLYYGMLVKEKKTFNVEFTTAFVGSRFVNIVREATDQHQAEWVARNLCRFGYISNTTLTDEVAAFTESTHAWAYDKDYEVYS